jgi:tRNA A-37 threonylcarbamoyl transferase component Bud32
MQPTADDPRSPPPSAEEPLPQRIGRYRILQRLGAGGMGTVYKALDPQLDRVVALKLPRFDNSARDRAVRVQRFQREARAAAQVWNPHVCPIHDVGEHEGQPYVVMAYLEGQSLAERLAKGGRYEDVGQAVALVCQILEALEAVHARGIIHRDLKPGNILIDPAGRAILTDFGLARHENDMEHLTSDGIVVGTPSYMAPEQAAGQSDQIGPWTDLYSLGVVFYHMLTGRLPFEGPALTVLSKILNEPPRPPSQLRTDLPPGLETSLLTALAREPAQRYQTARQWADVLKGNSGAGVAQGVLPATFADILAPAGPSRPALQGSQTMVTTFPEPDAHTRMAFKRGRWVAFPNCLAGCLLMLLGGVVSLGVGGLIALLVNRSGDTARATKGMAMPTAAARPMEMKTTMKAVKAEPVERWNRTFLDQAEKGSVIRVQEALDNHADINAKDEKGQTALMKAAAKGRISIIEALLRIGTQPRNFPSCIEVNEMDNKGETALMKAAENGQADAVEALLKYENVFDKTKVSINERDDQGETALMKAKMKDHTNVVDILKKAGAKE